jgi:hypothetical protein
MTSRSLQHLPASGLLSERVPWRSAELWFAGRHDVATIGELPERTMKVRPIARMQGECGALGTTKGPRDSDPLRARPRRTDALGGGPFLLPGSALGIAAGLRREAVSLEAS